MFDTTSKTMRAVAMDRFGGAETLKIQNLPVPEVGPTDVLIRVEVAGVAKWDPLEREGGFVEMLGITPKFPYVLGTDGAGTVVSVGKDVTPFKEGDRVYGAVLANPKGGFYAEYAAVPSECVGRVPANLSMEQAGVMLSDALTALDGLDRIIDLQPGEKVLVFGAGGGVGHFAVQLAKRMGAQVLAAASGDDGVALARRIGADVVVEGRREDVAAAARAFAPTGLDAALMTAGGETADRALKSVRAGGRVAYPNGVQPEPIAPDGVRLSNYDVAVDRTSIEKLTRLIEAGPFEVEVARVFRMGEAAESHAALSRHYVGKLGLRVR